MLCDANANVRAECTITCVKQIKRKSVMTIFIAQTGILLQREYSLG